MLQFLQKNYLFYKHIVNMKKGNVVLVLSIMAITLVLTGCGGPTPEEQAMQQLKTIAEVQDGVMSGEISNSQAEAILDEVQNKVVEESSHGIVGLPKWAKALGFEEPKGLEFSDGEETTESKDGYNSVSLRYTGDYDVAMAEAKRIAEKADVPSSLQDAMTGMVGGMEGMPEMEGIPGMEDVMADLQIGEIYTNFDLTINGLTDGGKYQKTITVDENGDFEIVVVDFEKYKEVAGQHGIRFN